MLIKMTRQLKIPSARKRMVRRASYLKERAEYLLDLDQIRSCWNRDFPTYRVRGVDEPPAGAWQCIADVFLPERLGEAVDQRVIGSAAAELKWKEVVGALCTKWWPVDYYPLWYLAPLHLHPAALFVSA